MGKPIEELAEEKKTPDWLVAATKTRMKWGLGKVVEEAEYDQAVAETGGMKFHAYPPDAKPTVMDAAKATKEPTPEADVAPKKK